MKKMVFFLSVTLSVFLLTSCLQKGLIQFQQKEKEIIATQQIKSFMQTNPNPSIVLRVPVSEKQATQSDPNNSIYNTIEKELVKKGFNVKDRGLFNEVVSKSKDIDYEQLRKLTGVELILELVRVDAKVPYKTNRVYHKGKEVVLQNYEIVKLGAVVEFKLIIIKNNEYGGSYSFFYTPCVTGNNDCWCILGYRGGGSKVFPTLSFCKDQNVGAYEGNEPDRLENLVKTAVNQVIDEIRKN